MIVHSKRNNNGSISLDIKLASEEKFNDIPYNKITGYGFHPLGGFEPRGVRLREYFRQRYSKNV